MAPPRRAPLSRAARAAHGPTLSPRCCRSVRRRGAPAGLARPGAAGLSSPSPRGGGAPPPGGTGGGAGAPPAAPPPPPPGGRAPPPPPAPAGGGGGAPPPPPPA